MKATAVWLVLNFRKFISQSRRSKGATTLRFVRKKRVHTSQYSSTEKEMAECGRSPGQVKSSQVLSFREQLSRLVTDQE